VLPQPAENGIWLILIAVLIFPGSEEPTVQPLRRNEARNSRPLRPGLFKGRLLELGGNPIIELIVAFTIKIFANFLFVQMKQNISRTRLL